jgi:CelD/BcsL family acetyltransferase involved in cellulose biosynthesis
VAPLIGSKTPRDQLRAPDGRCRIDIVDDIDGLQSDWTRLGQVCGNLFASWEWNSAWYGTTKSAHTPRIGVCSDPDAGVVALLPLVVTRRGTLRILRFFGYDVSDQCGPVCATADEGCAALALRELLSSFGTWDVFIGDHLGANGPWVRSIPDAREMRREPSPVLHAEGMTWDDFLDQKSCHFRQQSRRLDRVLHKAGTVRLRVATLSSFDADFDVFLFLHGHEFGVRSSLVQRADFHREFARLAAARGWLRLRLLYLDDRPAAATLSYRFGGDEWLYNVGRDVQFDRLSVGKVLLDWTLQDAMREGVGSFRFLRGGESYKYRYASEEQAVHSLITGRGSRGQTAVETVALLSSSHRWRRRASRLVSSG